VSLRWHGASPPPIVGTHKGLCERKNSRNFLHKLFFPEVNQALCHFLTEHTFDKSQISPNHLHRHFKLEVLLICFAHVCILSLDNILAAQNSFVHWAQFLESINDSPDLF